MAARTLTLHVPEAEIIKRKAAWKPLPPASERGYVDLYIRTVEQADVGADLNFLRGKSGSTVTRDSH